MEIIVLTAICAVFYAMFVISAGLAGGKINDWLAAVLYNGIGTVVPLMVYLASSAKGETTSRGVFFAGLAGVGIMLFSVLLARIFSKGGDLSFVLPAIYGSAIVLGSTFGWLVHKEKIEGLQGIGLGLVVTGVVCIVAAKLRAAQ